MVLVSAFHPTDMRAQPELATALANAYNDWLLEVDSPQHVFTSTFPKDLRQKILSGDARNFCDF